MGSEKMPIRRVAIEDTTTDRKDSGNNTRRSNGRGGNRRASFDELAQHETIEDRIRRKLGREGNSSQSKHLAASMNDAQHETCEERIHNNSQTTHLSASMNDSDFAYYKTRLREKMACKRSNSDETYEERDFASDERIAGKKSSSETYEEKVVRKSIAENFSLLQEYAIEDGAIEDGTEQTNHVAIEQEDSHDFHGPNICFDDVFADLQRFKQENDNSLTIPVSHSLFLKIVDKLSSLGMEDHQNKRWDHQFAGVKAFKREHGDCLIPPTHPTLGAWTATQSYHYKLFEQRLPSPLTKRRFRGLQHMGFDEFVNSKETNKNDTEAVKEEEEKHADVEAAESEAIAKIFSLDQKILLKKKATKAKLAAAEKAKNKDTDGKTKNETTGRGLRAEASSDKFPGKESVAAELHQKRELRRSARGGLNRSAILEMLADDVKCNLRHSGHLESDGSFFEKRKQLSKEDSFKLDELIKAKSDLNVDSSKAETTEDDLYVDSWSELGGVLAVAAINSLVDG